MQQAEMPMNSLANLTPEAREASYQWGQRVVALQDLGNDGSYPELAADAVLVEQGTEGEIVQVGHHAESNQPVYMVEFGTRVVGCTEDEIILAAELADMAAAARAAVSA